MRAFIRRYLLILISIVTPTHAAEVPLVILDAPDFARISIRVGDSVVWSGNGAKGQLAYRVVSVTGEWDSPPLVQDGPVFRFRFTEPGFYAYRALRLQGVPPYLPFDLANTLRPQVGTITVIPTNAVPPLVMLHSPVEGSRFGQEYFLLPSNDVFSSVEPIQLLASVENEFGAVARMEFYSGTNLLGFSTNAPYQFLHTNAIVGTNVVNARAIGTQGTEAWSQPVTVTVEVANQPRLYEPRIVRDRIFAVDYVFGGIGGYGLYRNDQWSGNWGRENLIVPIRGSGTFAEDAVTNRMKFYWWFEAQ